MVEKVDIFEKTPVLALGRSNVLWQARTSKGSVKASKVILSVNGYLQSFGFMQSSLMHIFLFASMTRAMSTVEVNNLGGEPSWGIAPANQFGSSVHKIYGVGGHRILMRNKFHYNSSMEGREMFKKRYATMNVVFSCAFRCSKVLKWNVAGEDGFA